MKSKRRNFLQTLAKGAMGLGVTSSLASTPIAASAKTKKPDYPDNPKEDGHVLFVTYKIKTHDTHRAYLSEEEINIIAEKHFSVERLSRVRDVFLFSCFTGLSYSDVAKLTSQDIVTGISGEKWIFTNRTKTGEASRAPLWYQP